MLKRHAVGFSNKCLAFCFATAFINACSGYKLSGALITTFKHLLYDYDISPEESKPHANVHVEKHCISLLVIRIL